MTGQSPARSSNLLILLWALVVLEFLSPIPAFLTLGAVYILLYRPPWFPELVRRLYEETR
jgi:hypothetical protein